MSVLWKVAFAMALLLPGGFLLLLPLWLKRALRGRFRRASAPAGHGTNLP